MSLSEEEIIQMYGKRWSIEVFFKACKSYLRLARDCRSISYDAMTAHVAVVFTRSCCWPEQRQNIDQRTIGDLFYLMVPELSDLPYYEALCRIMRQFADFIQQHALLDEQAVQEMLDIFMEQLPKMWTQDLRQCA